MLLGTALYRWSRQTMHFFNFEGITFVLALVARSPWIDFRGATPKYVHFFDPRDQGKRNRASVHRTTISMDLARIE